MPSSLNPTSGSNLPQEIEMVSPIVEGAAPETTAAELTPQTNKSNFEWNVARLYAHEQGHSELRTWAVRILSTLLVFPVALTAIVDIGRRIGFALGMNCGKSFSLIDQATDACKKIANQVTPLFNEKVKKMTLEDLNSNSAKAIEMHAERLIEGYKDLNGGYFSTNLSFSSPGALKAERQIEKSRADLIAEVANYVSRNASGSADFSLHLEEANRMVFEKISQAAKDEFYIANKVKRSGPRPLLRDIAFKEFIALQKPQNAYQFMSVVRNEPDFAAGLRAGVDAQILTPEYAKAELGHHAQTTYIQGLQTGLESSNQSLETILNSGIDHQIVTAEEARQIDEGFMLDVETLATAAAKDVVKGQDPQVETAEAEIDQKLSKAADGLKKSKKLKPEKETQFLTKAKEQLTRVREAIIGETLKAAQLNAEQEALKVAALQKANDQASLFNTFLGMLGLIGKKQEDQNEAFVKFNHLENTRQAVTNELDQIRRTKVTIEGDSMTVLEATRKYYAEISRISNAHATALVKQKQIEDLANQGFSQATIDLINRMQSLEPKLTGVLKEQADLTAKIDQQHDELTTLVAQYKVYKGHHFDGLEEENQKEVQTREKIISSNQRSLNESHKNLMLAGANLLERIKPEVEKQVNRDLEVNRREVEELLKASIPQPAQEPAVEEEVIGVPNAPSYPQMLWNLFTLKGLRG
jgi:hypothetical protein